MSDWNFDILMASFFRSKILAEALGKIAEKRPKELKNLCLLLHSEDQESLKVVKDFQDKIPLNVTEVNKVPTPGGSRNLLIGKSDSKWLCFLDDDVVISENYFETVTQIILNESVDVFGGPDQALADDPKQNLLGKILASKFVMGPTHIRHDRKTHIQRDTDEISLTLCNLWIKKEILEDENLKFSEVWNRCEENLLLDQIESRGKKMSYFPQLFVYHLRRVAVDQIFAIQLKSGFYRGLHLNHLDAKFKKSFLIPILTGIGLVVLPLISIKLFIALSLIHFLLNFSTNIKFIKEDSELKLLGYGILVVVAIHTGFSLGVFAGFMKGKIDDFKTS